MSPSPVARDRQTVGASEIPRRDVVLRALDRVVHDGIVLIGPDGRTIDYVNESACRLLASSPDPEDVLAALRPLLDDVQPERLTRVEVEGPEPRPLIVEMSPIDEEDCSGTLVILKDARALEVLEEDIFLANRMRGISQTVLALAHDLKTPINAVMLNLDVLRESLTRASADEEPDAERLDVVDSIRDELVRLQRSLQAVLVQAAPPSGARRTFDLRRLIREVVRLGRPLATGREVRIRVHSGEEPVPVSAHRDRLRQALRSVVVNAIEVSPRLGEVRIDVSRDRDEAVFSVRDEGPGFSTLDAERLCRLHYTTKPGGSGIGLFVARAAVVANGGTLRFRNRRNGGGAVEIRLPLHADRGSA